MDRFYRARFDTINAISHVNYEFNSNRHLQLACLNGNFENVFWLMQHNDITEEVIVCAIIGNNQDVVRYMNEWCNNSIAIAVCHFGRLDCMKLLKSNGYSFDVLEINATCRFGNIQNVIWLKDIGCSFNYYGLIHTVCETKNIELFNWLLDNGCEADEYTQWHVCRTGNLAFAKSFLAHGYTFTDFGMSGASFSGNLELMKFIDNIIHKPCESEYIIISACNTGICENVQWLIDHDYRISVMAFEAASHKGNLEIMKLLKKYNCPWSSRVLNYACNFGDIKNIEWLITSGCPTNQYTIEWCIRPTNGNIIPILKLLIKNGCNLNTTTFDLACYYRRLDVIEWLLENNCPVSKDAFYTICYLAADSIGFRIRYTKIISKILYSYHFIDHLEKYMSDPIVAKALNGALQHTCV